MKDPEANSVRELAQRYHLSIKRVDAILRLKGQEADWIKENKELQTGFRVGMERILVVTLEEETRNSREAKQARFDVDEADALEQEEDRDKNRAARDRYQRMYWESMSEGQVEPVTPAILQEAQLKVVEARRGEKDYKHQMSRVSLRDDASRKRVSVFEKPGRPTIKFYDVGGKFLDVHAERQRQKDAERRARQKEKKRGSAEEEEKARIASRR